MTTIKLKEEIFDLREKLDSLKSDIKTRKREMTEEEEKELASLKEEIEERKKRIREIEEENQEEVPEEKKEEAEKKEEEAERAAEEPEEEEKKEERAEEEEEKKEEERSTRKRSLKREKNIIKNKMNKLQYRFAEAVKNREYNRDINMNSRAITVTGQDGTHDALIEEEFTDILEPLYANNILSSLGVQFKTGLPMGDIHVPTMTKGTVGFLGEIDPAVGTTNDFDYITLAPKRIAAYTEISEMQLRQDTVGAFKAVQDNLLKKLNEYVQEVFFGNAQGTDKKPAGILYGVTPTEVSDYAGVCDLEAGVEDANVFGDMKYAMNPKAKAGFRCMLKGTNNTGMVYEAGEMDGTPTEVTSSIADNIAIYGKWDNIVFGTWGDTTLKIDDSISYINGLVRVYITAFVDWKVLRPEAFAVAEYKAE